MPKAKAELTGTLYAEMIRSGFENLRVNATVVNDLNVFPFLTVTRAKICV